MDRGLQGNPAMTQTGTLEGIERYKIDRKLSEGGMAEVYLAHRSDSGSGRPVVIKGVLPDYVGNDDYVRMMRNEARIAASLRHPNIVRIEDMVETDGRPFIVMEYLDGRNLNQIVQRAIAQKTTLSHAFVGSVVMNMLAGLGHAHDLADADGQPLGLVHRDVSLANVIVTWTGRVALIDFGIAKATTAVDDGLTRVGQIKGKTTYMSPEQVRREPLDRRSDLFSVGVVLWEMLAQRRLFARRVSLDSMMAICMQDAPPPSTYVPELPEALDRICQKALARDRELRYQSAAEMRADLEAVMTTAGWPTSEAALAEELAALFTEEAIAAEPAEAMVDVDEPVYARNAAHADERIIVIDASDEDEAVGTAAVGATAAAGGASERLPSLYDHHGAEDEDELATTVHGAPLYADEPIETYGALRLSATPTTTLRCPDLTLLNQRLPGPSVYDDWAPVARQVGFWRARNVLLLALLTSAIVLAAATILAQLGGGR